MLHKNLIKTNILICIAALNFISCGQDEKTHEELITIANNSCIKAILNKDLELLMTFYTQDALLIPPGEEKKGKEAVKDYWLKGLELA